MQLPKSLNPIGAEDIQNDPIHLIIFNEVGTRIYYAKMTPSQVALLNYNVGDEVLFTTADQPGVMVHHVHEIRKMLVNRQVGKHEIHIHILVGPFPPGQTAF